MNRRTGNIVTEYNAFYGEIEFDSQIVAITRLDNVKPDADWIVPGLVDVHFHGLGPYNTETRGEIGKIAEFAATTGVTGICPALSSSDHDGSIVFLKEIAEEMKTSAPNRARIIGAHLEGPYLDVAHKGGMCEECLRGIDLNEIQTFLDIAPGVMRLITLAPELPNAMEAIRFLRKNGVAVDLGHTGCSPEQLREAADAGATQVCHLFDTFDGRAVEFGVSIPCTADVALIEDRLYKELICDGVHVKQDLITLSHRAAGAEHLIAITDAMPGAGLPKGTHLISHGEEYFMDDVARVCNNPDLILGSCLSMNRAFGNLVTRFGFTPVEASWMTAKNPSLAIGEYDRGVIAVGRWADLACLKNGSFDVHETILEGKTIYAE